MSLHKIMYYLKKSVTALNELCRIKFFYGPRHNNLNNGRRKKMKKLLALLLFAMFALTMFTGCKAEDEEDKALLDEITAAGYPNANVLLNTSIGGVETFNLFAVADDTGTAGTLLATITGDSNVPTEAGMLAYEATITETANPGVIWLNGSLVDVDKDSANKFHGVATLNTGANYIAFLVYEQQIDDSWAAVGRSPIVKITSSVAESEFRFELTWDGYADCDLHIEGTNTTANETWAVYYGYKLYEADGYKVQLDLDEKIGFGPENIRIYTIPAGATFNSYLIYYGPGTEGDSGEIEATVTVYQGTELVDTASVTITAPSTTTKYLEDSWEVVKNNGKSVIKKSAVKSLNIDSARFLTAPKN